MTDARCQITEVRRQRTENPPALRLCRGRQKTEGTSCQRTENRVEMTDGRELMTTSKFMLTMVIDYGINYTKI